jgi:2-polyprenyl-3-methyl-5-hydroxy-6-metoxy-1,4-benzoquinol methylase
MQQLEKNEPFGLSRRVALLTKYILTKNELHRGALNASLAKLDTAEVAKLEKYLEFCETACNLNIAYLADCYLTIVEDTLGEQIYFQKHKTYRHASFADVADSVYFNADYMKHYMYGLAITSFFWPNHQSIMRFFEQTLPAQQEGKYLEIGPGHGFFLMTAMENSAYDEYEGVDISETSVNMTRQILQFYGAGRNKKYSVVLKDFLSANIPAGSCNAVVMGEVLEHVEQPLVFLRRIAEIAARDAYIFVTTCCNAPAVDHISLFHDAGEVEKLFGDAGLAVKKSLILPTPGQSMERCLKELLPVNVAYTLAKK